MLGALAGADVIEILVQLKDLSQVGFKKVESNLKSVEAKANATNFSGFSKASKGLEKDAEAAAGRGGAAGGGLGSLIAGFTGLPAPVAIAGIAIAAFAALSATVIPTYQKIQTQNALLDAAFRAHGETLDALRGKVDEQIKVGETYGFSADQTRAGLLELAQAGHKWTDISKIMPTVLAYAERKHLDLGEAAKRLELAFMGNARALREMGIALPPVSAKVYDAAKAHLAVVDASAKLKIAQAELAALEAKHAVTTTHLTTATHGSAASAEELRVAHDRVSIAVARLTELEGKKTTSASTLMSAQLRVRTAEDHLKTLEDKHVVTTEKLTTKTKGHAASALQLEKAQLKVKEATDKLKDAQARVLTPTELAAKSANRQRLVLDKLDARMGSLKPHASSLAVSQAKLNDAWEKFANTIGPALSLAVDGLTTALGFLLDKLSDILGAISGAGAAVGRFLHSSGGRGTGTVASNRYGTIHRQSGGPVLPGGVYTVGEAGPEMLMMGASGGMVIPHGGGGEVTIHIPVYLDGRVIADIVERHLGRRFAGAGTSAALAYGS